MSKYSGRKGGVNINKIVKAKSQGRKLSAITCYDAAFAKLVDQTEIDMVLVGDSLGNVMLGHESTIPVTIEDMVYHARSVARILTRPLRRSARDTATPSASTGSISGSLACRPCETRNGCGQPPDKNSSRGPYLM